MYPKVSDISAALENLAPQAMAEAWDNVGLQVGDRDREVKSIWVALDPTYQVVQAACRQNVDLLITHHPLIFKPLLSLDYHSAVGSILSLAVRHHLAIFAAHTNLDSALGGINDILAGRIGLHDIEPLAEFDADRQLGQDRSLSSGSDQRFGIGRVGLLDSEMDLNSLALKIKSILKLRYLKLAGDPALAVNKVAICSGSGASLMTEFMASGAQAFVSGDLRYHDARDAEAAQRGLIDIGHFASEHLIVDALAEKLSGIFADSDLNPIVRACDIEKDPFTVIL
ncbi:MAG: Nif3-like dinuclear metal center hexameric protein [Deltaproteobacteria bacterium]|nr:Nif3-like dinuclear metal center hexameric protein [Deltaproteobacteria bacterium]